MTREYINFSELDEFDQEWFLKESWCDKCNEADLGLKEPIMYKENGKTFIEGKCIVCGEPQISTIITKEIKE